MLHEIFFFYEEQNTKHLLLLTSCVKYGLNWPFNTKFSYVIKLTAGPIRAKQAQYRKPGPIGQISFNMEC